MSNVTSKSSYAIPVVDDILTFLRDAQYFTTMDMWWKLAGGAEIKFRAVHNICDLWTYILRI